MANNNKEFSVLKWFVFPPIIAALMGVVLYFNVTAFGWDDSIPYFAAMGAAFLCSLVGCHFCGHKTRGVRRAAFAFEVLTIAVLIGNAAYSFSAQRDMSIARQVGADQSKALGEIKKLRSLRAQSEAVAQLGKRAEVGDVFSKVENTLRLFMIGELVFALGGVFVVYGLTAIRGGAKPRRRPFSEQKTVYQDAPSIPESGRVGFAESYGKSREVAGSFQEVEARRREETSQNFLKLKPQDSGLVVKSAGGYIGHISWDKWKRLESEGRTDYESIRRELPD